MDTERDIIYTMLEVLKGSELNNDELIGERLLRNLLAKYRADLMRKHYKNGITVDPEVFQLKKITLSSIYFSNELVNTEFKATLPKLIRFPKNTGYYIEKDGYGIPLLDPSEYRAERRNFNTKFQPKGKVISNDIYIYIGDKDSQHIEEFSETYYLIKSLEDSVSSNKIILDMYCVLQDPSDADNYNWKTDSYPFPAERINEIVNQIYSKEFGIMVQAKPDEIQNARADKIIYHQNDDVSQN